MQPQIRLLGSQQMHHLCPGPAAHSWADLALQSCHHHYAGGPMWVSCCHHSTTVRRLETHWHRFLLLPPLLVVQQQWGSPCLQPVHPPAIEKGRPKCARPRWQASGVLVETISGPKSSSPVLWRTEEVKCSHCDRLAKLKSLETSIKSTKVAQHDNTRRKRNVEPNWLFGK